MVTECQDLRAGEYCGRPADAIVGCFDHGRFATIPLCGRHARDQLERDVQSEWVLVFGTASANAYDSE